LGCVTSLANPPRQASIFCRKNNVLYQYTLLAANDTMAKTPKLPSVWESFKPDTYIFHEIKRNVPLHVRAAKTRPSQTVVFRSRGIIESAHLFFCSAQLENLEDVRESVERTSLYEPRAVQGQAAN